MLPFDLIGQPGPDAALALLGPARDLPLLVVYHGELARRAFLKRILGAAGYREPGRQLHLLEWPADRSLDLSGLIRRLGVHRVILFGYTPDLLGLHLHVANYTPVTLAGVSYLFADSLSYIEETKAEGDNRPAAALWNSIREHFLAPDPLT
ncbi:hypothetical protein [Lewinella sp. IMCC34183]|uniref:hypothetical protein n=1 Tax=Lewinella sp. IMCC34183 TaxID=2248762 RepID=UPI000E24AF89|nr:hypothetical protein [Lewinella sp. IMCC34183]